MNSEVFFYGSKKRWDEDDFDYRHYINEPNNCCSLLLFFYESDADEWMSEYMFLQSSYDNKDCLYKAWDLNNREYKTYLRDEWMPLVHDFIYGVCENEYEMVPIDLHVKIHRAQLKTGVQRIQWPPVYTIVCNGTRTLELSSEHDWVGRLL